MYQAIHLEDSEIDKPFNSLEIVSLFKCRKCTHVKRFIEFYHSSYGDGICPNCGTMYEEKCVKNSNNTSIRGGKITKEKENELKSNRPYILGHFPVENTDEKGAFFISPKKYWITTSHNQINPEKGLYQSFINYDPKFIKSYINNPGNDIYKEIRTIRSTIKNISNDVKENVNAIFGFLKEILINIWKENNEINIQDINLKQTLNEKCLKALHDLRTTDIISCDRMLESALSSLYAPDIVNDPISNNNDEINGSNEKAQEKQSNKRKFKEINDSNEKKEKQFKKPKCNGTNDSNEKEIVEEKQSNNETNTLKSDEIKQKRPILKPRKKSKKKEEKREKR